MTGWERTGKWGDVEEWTRGTDQKGHDVNAYNPQTTTYLVRVSSDDGSWTTFHGPFRKADTARRWADDVLHRVKNDTYVAVETVMKPDDEAIRICHGSVFTS